MSEQKHTPTTIEGIRRDIQVTLRLKGILGPNYEQWLCKFDNGIEIDIINLLIEERLKGSPKLLQQVAELTKENELLKREIEKLENEIWELKRWSVHQELSEQSQRIQQLEEALREALPLMKYVGYNGIATKIESLLHDK